MWREHAAELRRLAADASDPQRCRKLLDLAAKLEEAAQDADRGVVNSPFATR